MADMTPAPGRRLVRLPGSVLILAGASLGPCVAWAGTPGADCLEIADAVERLACFDVAIGNAVHGGSAAKSAPSAAPVTAAEAVPVAPPRAASLIDTAWGFLPDSRRAYVRLHQPNYLLLGRYTTDANTAPYEPLFDAFNEEGDFDDVEAKFQLSFKGRLLATDDHRWGLWFAYTQQSQWQLYSPDISRPFRETNYMPEIFGSFRPGVDIGGWQWNLVNFGYTHQSNGRSDPISRSWDRLFVEAGFERENFVLLARAWTRITPSDYEDDNPDIVDYYGHGEITGIYKWRDNSFTLMGRGNLSTGKGAAQFTWASRPLLGPLRGYLQVFTGYGESMIDYDWNQTTIGVGVTLNDRF
jgi:phospholipase A1/A2